ncbi:MAG: leucine-rich repeat domain-containing protein [Monoglobaceae bacterium]
MLKRFIMVLISIVFLGVITICSATAETFVVRTYYPCGPTADFSIENGVLKITGTGEMYDFLTIERGKANYYQKGSSIYSFLPWRTDENDDESMKIYKIIVEEGITYIGANAFKNMSDVTEVSLPSTLEIIGPGAFYGCGALKSIDIPASVKSIGRRDMTAYGAVFEYCKSLESIAIPENSELKYIEPGTFFGSGTINGLEIFIPEKVEEIGFAAMDGMISKITVADSNAKYCSEDGVLYSKDMKTLVAYPKLKQNESFVIPDTVTKIEEKALHGFGLGMFVSKTSTGQKTAKIYIPNSVKEIGKEALNTETPIEVFFSGSESEWNNFVESDAISLVHEKVHFNYSGNNSIKYVVIVSLIMIAFIAVTVVVKKKRTGKDKPDIGG